VAFWIFAPCSLLVYQRIRGTSSEHVPPKRWYTTRRLHGSTIQKTTHYLDTHHRENLKSYITNSLAWKHVRKCSHSIIPARWPRLDLLNSASDVRVGGIPSRGAWAPVWLGDITGRGFPRVVVRAPIWLRISHPVPSVHRSARSSSCKVPVIVRFQPSWEYVILK
jgi:hypothetical protein